MKNSNSIIGLALIGMAFALLYVQNKQMQDAAPAERPFLPPSAQETADPAMGEQAVRSVTDEGETEFEPEVRRATADIEERVERNPVASTDLTLSNGFLSVDFTNTGGAIKEIRFLRTKRGGEDDFVFNQGSRITALQLSRREPGGAPRLLNYPFTIMSQDQHSVVFEYDTGKGVKFVRTYELQDSGDKPYAIRHSTTVVNYNTVDAFTIAGGRNSELLLTLGAALPVESDEHGEFQSFAYFDGKKTHFTKSSFFTGSRGFLGLGAKAARPRYEADSVNFRWAAVKNQFFVTVFTPDQNPDSLSAYSEVVPPFPGKNTATVGIVGQMGFKPDIIPQGGQFQIQGTYYVGPKEFSRLTLLGEKQDELMQYGIFATVSKILLSLMYFIHGFVGNWGASIILMTVIVKGVFWPLTSYSARSSKKMMLLQEPMKELREKFADKPEKLQKETMELFKKYGVNPLAGCLPMLVQIPIFIGLFWMLRTSSELRYEPFLWITDLSKPDTVAMLGGFPLNIMPLLNGAAMFVQMQLVPMSPTADPAQQRIMRFFPLIFLFFMYGFSSGLVLYWTVQSVLSIIQTLLVYRSKENLTLKPVVATATTGAGASRKARPGSAKKRS
jgi:YidC/Oxa1 family membrane protein insertase